MQSHFTMIRSDVLEVVLAHLSARGRGRVACVSTSSAALLRARFPSQPYGTRLTVWGGEEWEVAETASQGGALGYGVVAFRHNSTQATVMLRYCRLPDSCPRISFFAMRCGQGDEWMRYTEDRPHFLPGYTGLGGFFQSVDKNHGVEPLDSTREDPQGAGSQRLFEKIRKDSGKYRVSLDSLDDLEPYRTSRTVFRHCSVSEDGSLAGHFKGPWGTALRIELSRSGAALFFTSAKDWPIPDAKEQVRVGLRFYTPAEKSSYCTACGANAGSLGVGYVGCREPDVAEERMMVQFRISPGCKPCRNAPEQESVPACADCGASSGSFGAWGGPKWWCQACWEAYDKSFQRGAAR